jgi:hypothetical protein
MSFITLDRIARIKLADLKRLHEETRALAKHADDPAPHYEAFYQQACALLYAFGEMEELFAQAEMMEGDK